MDYQLIETLGTKGDKIKIIEYENGRRQDAYEGELITVSWEDSYAEIEYKTRNGLRDKKVFQYVDRVIPKQEGFGISIRSGKHSYTLTNLTEKKKILL